MTETAETNMRGLMERASRALGKIDAYGVRGVTTVSVEEITAMALILACLGLVPTPPTTEPPARLYAPSTETIQ